MSERSVPGGRVQKGKRLKSAIQVVAESELGESVSVESELGTYEHLYDVVDVSDASGKHYLANGFVVFPEHSEFKLNGQHDAVRIFETPPDDLHPYVEAYLRDAGILSN